METDVDDILLGQEIITKLKAGKISTWVITVDHGSTTLRLSDNVDDIMGNGPSDIPTDWEQYVRERIHPDEQDVILQYVGKMLAAPGQPFNVEYRVWNSREEDWVWVFAFGSADRVSEDGLTARMSGGVQDIQERVEAKRLREHEHSLNTSLIASLPGSYLVTDELGRIIRWNSHFEKTFISCRETPLGQQWTRIFLPEERDMAEATFAAADDANTHNFSVHALRGDGSQGYYFCQCRRFTESENAYMLVLLFDVSAEEAAKAQLRRQSFRLDTVIAAANLGTWDWNLVTGEVYYNKTWADIVGLKLEDIQGSVNAWEDAVLPEDLPAAMEAVEAHVRGETPMYEAEFRMQHADGRIIWGVDRGRVVEKDESGSIIRLMGVLQDITAAKTAEAELTRSKKQLEMVVRETGLGTWDWNPITNDIFYNDTFFSMLGYKPGELAATFASWSALIHPDDLEDANKLLAPLLAGETTEYECEMRIRHKEGRYIWTYDIGRAVEWDAKGRVSRVIGGHFDIDKRKKQEQEQKEALHTIAFQKVVLEQAVEERTTLLRRAKRRVDAILADSAPQAENAGSACTPEEETAAPARARYDESELPLVFAEETSDFSESLGKAFDLIMEKMWWYKAIIDSIPFPIFVADMEERWTYLNRPALETIGAASPREVLGTPCLPWGIDQDMDDENRPQEDGTRSISRYHPDLDRYFQGQASYLYDQAGNRIGRIEAVQDVTEMHDADERTRIMLDATPLACNFWNARLELSDCNLAAPRLFGLSGKQEYIRRFFEFLPERQPNGRNSREAIQENLRKAFVEGYHRFEWDFQLPDGSLMPTDVTLVSVEYEKDFIVLGYTRDLTELKRKEAEVDKERQLLSKIMNSSPVCFVILVDDVICFATPHALNFFGVDLGSNVAEFYVEKEERELFLNEVQRNGMINWRVVRVRASDGSTREMLANAFLAEYYGERCVMSWFLDITEMCETERQLRLARDAAEESTRAKGQFLANMSHEIRTPMNAILGMTRLVLDTSLSPRQRGHLEKAEQSARALLRILNDILDFSKIEAGRLEMECSDFSLQEVLNGVVDMFRESADARGLALSLSMDEDGTFFLRGDPLRLHQILINLVGNAIKFTERGGVYVTVTALERDQESVRLLFSVRDTGIGLSEEQRNKLFSAFTQADSSMTRRYGGTGLGLVISKRLVEMMDGEIFCASEPGRGADFSFTARFALSPPEARERLALFGEQSDAQLPGTPEEKAEARIAHLKGKRILVAEDNEINQIVARELLEKAGFFVEIASNGREAIEKVLANQYDLVFMDIQMPDMDGLSAAVELRRRPHLHALPIVAMTAHAMVGDKEKSLAAGMNGHVTKPIDQDEVFTAIAACLSPPVRENAETRGPLSGPVDKQPSLQERIVTELPSTLPGIDVASGVARVAGNKKLYVKLLRHVAADAPSTREKLTAAIGEGNAQAVREIAHSLKGSSANLSITEVAAAAEHLETAAKAEDFGSLFTHLDALEVALDEFVAVVGTLEGL